MPTLTAPRSIACLCALLSLASCGLLPQRTPPPTITRTELVQVPVPAYRPLPRELTDPIPEPPAPPFDCDGRVCVLDGLVTIPLYQAALDMCNADRRRAALLGATDGAQ